MARIRSLHPTQWTDEQFVSCSAFARLLALGLRNEADDQGVFEWKPLTLKMRLLPADSVDVEELLSELEGSGQIVSFECEGRKYGVIRNFRKYQSPQKPKLTYPLPSKYHTFIGFKVDGTVQNPPQDDDTTGQDPISGDLNTESVQDGYDTGSGKSNAMDDGGGEGRDNNTPPISGEIGVGEIPELSRLPKSNGGTRQYPDAFEDFWRTFPQNPNDTKAGAYQAWRRAVRRKDVSIEEVQAGVERFAFSAKDRPPDKRPHVQTWINREGWTAAHANGQDRINSYRDEEAEIYRNVL